MPWAKDCRTQVRPGPPWFQGPCFLEGPCPGSEANLRVRARLEMRDVIAGLSLELDAVVMAAAVSDYRPSQRAPQKLKKVARSHTVLLEPNLTSWPLLETSSLRLRCW